LAPSVRQPLDCDHPEDRTGSVPTRVPCLAPACIEVAPRLADGRHVEFLDAHLVVAHSLPRESVADDGRVPRFRDVVGPDDVSAALDGHRRGGQRDRQRRLGGPAGQFPEEVLAVDRDEDGLAERAKLPEATERLAVVGEGLLLAPAAERGIHEGLVGQAATAERVVDVADGFDGTRPFEVRRAGHLRHRDVVLFADAWHLRVGEPADVVDHVEPPREGCLGHLVVARLDGEDRVARDGLHRLDGGVQSFEFRLGREDVEALVCRLQADVDDVGTLLDEFLVDVACGRPRFVEDGGVVGGFLADVQNAHDARGVVVADRQASGVDCLHVCVLGGRH